MKNILLLLLLTTSSVLSQKIEILNYSELPEKYPYEGFWYLQPKTDLATAIHVANIKCTGSLKKSTLLFQYIKAEAQKMSANTFTIIDFKRLPDRENAELTLAIYRADDALVKANSQNTDTNKVYVFGDENLLSAKTQGYKIDGTKFDIKAGSYRVHDLPVGTEIKLSKGGFTGTALWVKGEPNMPNIYVTFGGFGVAGASYSPGNAGMGVGFTTGTINEVREDMAAVLLHIFTTMP